MNDSLSYSLSPYETIVDISGTDNSLVRDSFYLYWAFSPAWTDWAQQHPPPGETHPAYGLRQVYRQKVSLVAPR